MAFGAVNSSSGIPAGAAEMPPTVKAKISMERMASPRHFSTLREGLGSPSPSPPGYLGISSHPLDISTRDEGRPLIRLGNRLTVANRALEMVIQRPDRRLSR